MERVLVTGASGKLGSVTVRHLVEHGYEVVAVDRVGPREAHPDGVQTMVLDLLNAGEVAGAMRGCETVIHLGAIPNPYGHPDEVVFRNNTQATYAVLEAASLLGISRAAIASSGSIYGMAWSKKPLSFQYAPVDEAHPLMVHDVYALSKEVDERTAEMVSRREGMSVVALRFHWIGTRQEQIDRVAKYRTSEDHTGEGSNLWGYVDIVDAARACQLAIETARARDLGFVPLNIVAADTLADAPTAEMMRRWAPEVEIREDIDGSGSAYDTRAAKRVIGWEAEHSWRDDG